LIELRVLRVSLSGKRKKKNLFSKFCWNSAVVCGGLLPKCRVV
jgi:hypothetical protein